MHIALLFIAIVLKSYNKIEYTEELLKHPHQLKMEIKVNKVRYKARVNGLFSTLITTLVFPSYSDNCSLPD